MTQAADDADRRAGDAPVDPPIVNIVGELVALGPLVKALLPLYSRWINDLATVRNLSLWRPQTLEQEQAWYDEAPASEHSVTFTLYERATWRPIGTIGLSDIDHRNGKAELGIMIGEPACRGKGYGSEATRLILDYAFTALGLHNVMLHVFSFNAGAIRAYQKAGFREFGRRRECYLMNGRLWDDVHMECLSTEFSSPVLARAFAPEER